MKSRKRLEPKKSIWFPLVLSMCSGMLYALSFPGRDQWLLSFFLLIPLFYAVQRVNDQGIRDRKVRVGCRVLFVSWCFGITANLIAMYWLVPTLGNFSGFPLLVNVGLSTILCVYQGGVWAVFGWLWWVLSERRQGEKKSGLGRIVVGPGLAGAIAVVIAEGTYPLLFRYYFGNQLHDVPPLIQIADVGGPLLVSAFLVAVNGILYRVSVSLLRRPARSIVGNHLIHGFVEVAVLFGAVVAYGSFRISNIEEEMKHSDNFRVGIVQPNMDMFENHRDPSEGHYRLVRESLRIEADRSLDLLIWPESAFNYFLPESVSDVSRLVMTHRRILEQRHSVAGSAKETNGQIHTPILFGGLGVRKGEGGVGRRRHYNTAFLVGNDGKVLGTYDKTFLLAFGEYLPFGETFPVLYDWSPNSSRFSPGESVHSLNLGPVRVGVLICYEDLLPRFVRSLMREDNPQILVNLTNDAWFGDTTEPWIHMALAKMRAVEQHRFLVRSTNSGVSVVVDPTGKTLQTLGVYKDGSLVADLNLLEIQTLYSRFGDWIFWIAIVLLVLVVYSRYRKGETSTE